MVGECGTSHTSKTYRYYKCVTQKRKHACDKKTVNKDTIENQVVKAVMNKIMDDELMEHLADSLYSLQLSEETRIPQLKEELVNTERGINNMLDAIQKGIILDSTKKRLSDLEERKKALEIELVQEQIRKPILTREQILFGITKFRNLDTSTQEGKRTLIESFVNAIYLYDTYALVTCNYKDGTIRISFEEIESSDLLSNGVPKNAECSLAFGIFCTLSRESVLGSSIRRSRILAEGLPLAGNGKFPLQKTFSHFSRYCSTRKLTFLAYRE